MNRLYRFHPADYAVGQTEAFYGKMARKGLLLEKRGAYLSRFRKGKPENKVYRVELASPSLLDDDSRLPEEQIQLYEECGWKYTTSHGLIHVFTTEENSGAPEIYSDPRQQASTVKALRRNYLLSWLPPLFLLFLNVLLYASLAGSQNFLIRLRYFFQRAWVEETAGLLAYIFGMAFLFFGMIYAAYRSGMLYRRLRKGIPIDHTGRERHILHRIPQGGFLLLFLIFLAGSVFQRVQTASYPMPFESDGPYLTLNMLGIKGERGKSLQGNPSSVEKEQSLVAKQWHTFECISESNTEYWMYQDIYSFKTQQQAADFLTALMYTATFADSPSDFTKTEAENLDEAYASDLELLCRKGNTVYSITYADISPDNRYVSLIWKAIAEKY